MVRRAAGRCVPPSAACIAARRFQRLLGPHRFCVVDSAYSRDPRQLFGELWPAFEQLGTGQWGGNAGHLHRNRAVDPSQAGSSQSACGLGRQYPDPSEDLFSPEYDQLGRGCGSEVREGEFEAVPQQPPEEFGSLLSGLAIAQRLREVQALTSFTRIAPPLGPFRDAVQRDSRLSRKALDWLPANELRGEGMFLRLSDDSVRKWESQANVKDRYDARADRDPGRSVPR